MDTTPGYIIHFSIMTCLKYTITPVDAAVDFPSTAVRYAVDQSVPRGSIRKTKYTFWFSASLRLTPMNYLARKTLTIFIVSFQNIVNLSKIPLTFSSLLVPCTSTFDA